MGDMSTNLRAFFFKLPQWLQLFGEWLKEATPVLAVHVPTGWPYVLRKELCYTRTGGVVQGGVFA
jgi:hypothetical protein